MEPTGVISFLSLGLSRLLRPFAPDARKCVVCGRPVGPEDHVLRGDHVHYECSFFVGHREPE